MQVRDTARRSRLVTTKDIELFTQLTRAPGACPPLRPPSHAPLDEPDRDARAA
jgi:hypothetical protein